MVAARDRERIAVESACPVDEIGDEQRDFHFEAVMMSMFFLKMAGVIYPRQIARTMPWRSMKTLFGRVSIWYAAPTDPGSITMGYAMPICFANGATCVGASSSSTPMKTMRDLRAGYCLTMNGSSSLHG